MNFRSVAKMARERTGLSARSLSRQAGLSDSYVSKMEAGSIKPNLEAFAKLAKVLRLNDKELLFMVRLIGEDYQIQS